MSSNRSIILRKCGGFYQAFDEDAHIINYFFNYKIKDHRCGFPLTSINKIINLLEEKQINYIIREEEDIIKDFKKKNNYEKYLIKAINKNNINKRIENILNKLYQLDIESLEEILRQLEDKINE